MIAAVVAAVDEVAVEAMVQLAYGFVAVSVGSAVAFDPLVALCWLHWLKNPRIWSSVNPWFFRESMKPCCWFWANPGGTIPSVNYAKDWLDHLLLFPGLVWSEKEFYFGCDH